MPHVILVVDDDEAVLALMSAVLQREGYDVMTAASGAEALAAGQAVEWKLDLLVTDCVMGELTGPALAELLLAQAPDLPVLFLSGWFGDDEFAARVARGEVHFLRKPFTPNELSAKVGELLKFSP